MAPSSCLYCTGNTKQTRERGHAITFPESQDGERGFLIKVARKRGYPSLFFSARLPHSFWAVIYVQKTWQRLSFLCSQRSAVPYQSARSNKGQVSASRLSFLISANAHGIPCCSSDVAARHTTVSYKNGTSNPVCLVGDSFSAR